MKKIIYNQFGGPDVLTMIDTPIPDLTDTTILIKIKAVSINPLDWKIREGEMKLMSGSKLPKGVGIDFSGIVEKAGGSIRTFKKGDEVFGSVNQFKGGALAEYLLVSEKDIALKPAKSSFAQAAALPVVGFAALGIFDQLITIRQGTEVLINGATGGIGMLATQIAKKQGAVVTAIVNEKGTTLATKWGADVVRTYRQGPPPGPAKQYDVIIDLSGKMPFDQAKGQLKPSSTYVNTIPGPRQIIGSLVHNLFSKKKYRVLLSKPSAAYLQTLSEYVNDGLEVVIGRTYKMTAFKEAYAEMPQGGIVGKAVFTLDE